MSNARVARHRSVEWTQMRVVVVAATLSVGLIAAATSVASIPTASGHGAAHTYIVEGASTRAAAAGVAADHGTVVSSLPIVHGVVAKLTADEATAAGQSGLSVSPDLTVHVEGSAAPANADVSSNFAAVDGASSMLSNGINGAGVTVAVLDTGIDAALPDFRSRVIGGVNLSSSAFGWGVDRYGHGTFVAGLIASNGASSSGQYAGVAPGADLVSIKVAPATGVTSESTVIQGVSWAIANQATYGIRVLNISLGVEPTSPSALDPLDQAVEQAWDSGIVVVTSAGNSGPANGSITSPGDDPLVLTVGAIADGGADVPANFTVPAFSSVGPTLDDGWFKPDLVAPGRSVISVMAPNSTIWSANPSARIGTDNFVGSGTSFSTAIVSGLVALLLQQDPTLTPDQVKAALLMSATAGPVGDPLVDGHGVANVSAASAVAGQVSLNQGAAEAAESQSPPATVSLSSSWAASSWNPANWSGPAWEASPLSTAALNSSATNSVSGVSGVSGVQGLAWNGAAWNGAAWNGAAWTGAAWNGAAWNGAAWNGAAWNGAAWNDDSWG